VLDLGKNLRVETPGILGLVPFAEHCRNLRHLTIFVDATENIPTDAHHLKIRKSGISNNRLRILDLGQSRVQDAVVFSSAYFISLIFPKLGNIITRPDDEYREDLFQSAASLAEDENHMRRKLWKRIEQLVPHLVSAHVAEEKYLAMSQ
jgi:hypothetical protein